MTVPWSGGGLPPAAAERMAELRQSGTWTSALSTGEFAALKAVGFDPVGQVMGSAVFQIARSGRYWGYHDCLYQGAGYNFSYGNRGEAPVALSGQRAPSWQLVEVFDRARRTALGRMTAECSALSGDGVVAAELTMQPFPSAPNCMEFKVIGTAVRARGNVRPKRPFTCHLDGQGFAKLVSSGWVPVELLIGMSIGVRHDDYRTQSQMYSWQNTEMTGWSKLIHDIRADAREQLKKQSVQSGGGGVIMAAGDLRVWEESCIRAANRNNSEQRDHVAEATMVGTSIVQFDRGPAKTRTLSVMPLGKRGDRLRKRLEAVASSPYGDPYEYRRLLTEITDLGDQG